MTIELDLRSTALLAIHWQHDIVAPDGAFGPLFAPEVERTASLDAAARLIDGARRAALPIVYTQVAFRADGADLTPNIPLLQQVGAAGAATAGSRGAAIVEAVAPEAADLVVTHTRISGFHGTALDSLLRGRGVDTVLLAGVATNVSVESTARAAADHGYRTVVVTDACSAATAEAHDASLGSLALLTELTTVDEVLAALR